jgi:hypothetical protein
MIADHDASDVPPNDLTPLDPMADSRRFDRLAQSIVRDGMAARRATIVATPQDAMAHVARWSIPILAAAAVVVAAAIPMLTWSMRDFSPALANAPSDRFGLPAPVLALTRSGSDPTPADVIAAFDSRWREATR